MAVQLRLGVGQRHGVYKEQEKSQTYLIILLESSKQHRTQRYFVSAWFIPDGRKDKFDFRTGYDC